MKQSITTRQIAYWLCFCVASTLYACSFGTDDSKNNSQPRQAKGGRYYGGKFKLSESEYIKNLFPHSIIDVYSYRVACQVYEGLFKFNQANLEEEPMPALAESYEKDASGLVYTFKLRKGVVFHDADCFAGNKGRELKAEDIKYAFTRLCTQNAMNQAFTIFDGVVKGARAYYDASKDGKTPNIEVEGVKVIDDYTVQITLEKPNSLFISALARPETMIFPREAYEKYGQEMRIKAVGTGPYKIANVDDDISIILKKNENYYKKDQFGNVLPFIDEIDISFIKDKTTELFQFKQGNLDMMYRLPTDYIIEILDETRTDSDGGYSKYELQRVPEMQTQIFAFLTEGEKDKNPFVDVNVRKAFSYAIDRETILEFVLNGEGYAPGLHGVTPPVFKKKYDISKVTGFTFNADSARYYLNKAGYANGKGFPKVTLDFNSEGLRHHNVAVEVQKQLKKNLSVDINIVIHPHAQITEKCLTGNYSFIRLSWIADYPNPQNFLWMFYGKNVPEKLGEKSYPNITRYQNPKFDELYEKAITATTEEEAMKYFMQAENLVMRDAPVLVLWYDECYRLLQARVKNFPTNSMQFRDFSEVYLEPLKESASQ